MNSQVNIIELNNASSLGKIISSKTAQEIISFIGDNEGCTASQIKTALDIPASSVHYNLKALIQSNIVDDSNFTYSSKGKQVIHHSLTNKILIVVPKTQNISAQLKQFIPGLLGIATIAIVSIGLKMSSGNFLSARRSEFLASNVMNSAPKAMFESADMTPAMANLASRTVSQTITPWYSGYEFLLGLLVAIVCFIGFYLIYKLIKKNKK